MPEPSLTNRSSENEPLGVYLPLNTNVADDPDGRSKITRIRLPDLFFERQNLKAFLFCSANLTVIVGAGQLAWRSPHLAISILCFFLVGARAQSLYILQYECMHWLLFSRRRWNDVWGTVISGCLGTGLHTGRVFHFKHHREVGTSKDPNQVWHGTEDRLPGWPAARYFLGQLFGGRLVNSLLGLFFRKSQNSNSPEFSVSERRLFRFDLILIGICQLALLGLFSLISSPWAYFLFYLGPLLTVTAFLEAIRSFSEHVLPGKVPKNEAERDRLFFMQSNPLERFFVSQFNFYYHHVHHLYPNVVTFKLPELHQYLLENDPAFQQRFIQRSGYFSVALQYIRNRPFPGTGTSYPY